MTYIALEYRAAQRGGGGVGGREGGWGKIGKYRLRRQ